MNIKIDSRKVKKGDVFVAIKTLNNDGHDYIYDAINNGASKIICQYGNYPVDFEVVNDTRKYLSEVLKKQYYSKISNLKLIGITGTNGKTTSAFLIYQALNKLGIKCAYIGTIGFYMNGFVKELNNTTPELLDIYEMLLKCSEENYEYVVMEVSSHALSMKRVDGLLFEYAIFTNLTLDHLDYHKTINNYIKSKQKLFKMCKNAIINIDDKYSKKFIFKKNFNYTYGLKESNYIISDINVKSNYSSFKLNGKSYKTKLLGKYNIYNIINVIILLDLMNQKVTKKLISSLNPPNGRMEIIPYKKSKIIIDYAHTPDAVLNILLTIKNIATNNIYTIIGCGGNRDKSKRPIMSNIALSNSSYVILTSDNPRNENQDNIIKDMLKENNYNNYIVINNRKKAIIHGINMLKNKDFLLILGKGHENYQIIGNKKYNFDDKEVVMSYINRML